MPGWVFSVIGLFGKVIGWLFNRQRQRRNDRRQLWEDLTNILDQQITDTEKHLSRASNVDDKNRLNNELERYNATKRWINNKRLEQTLEALGLPTDELIADGISQLLPSQVDELKEEVTEIKELPQSDSISELKTFASGYYYAEQYEDAKNVYDRILELNPSDKDTLAGTYALRGMTLRCMERYPEALNDFDKSLEIRPNIIEIFVNRGITYHFMGRYQKALDDFDKALGNDPKNANALMYKGITLSYTSNERYQEALENLSKSDDLRPDYPITLYNIARVLSLLEKPSDAHQYLEKAKANPDFDNIRKDHRYKKFFEPF